MSSKSRSSELILWFSPQFCVTISRFNFQSCLVGSNDTWRGEGDTWRVFIPWFCITFSRGYLCGFFCKGGWLPVFMMAGCEAQNVSALKEKNVCFPNYRESRVYGDSTKTKKTAVTRNMAAKVPFRRVQFRFQRAVPYVTCSLSIPY